MKGLYVYNMHKGIYNPFACRLFQREKQDGHKYIMCQMCRTRRKREEKEKGKNEDAKTL